MDDYLRGEIAAIAGDTRSGATALLGRALAVLRAAAADRETLEAAADELCRAQPGMAGFRAAVSVARRAPDPVVALDDFAARITRAPRTIARHAVGVLRLRRRGGAIRLVTCSRSSAVEETLRHLAGSHDVEVACAEGQPALEGRDLAVSLADAGVAVALYTDAGVSGAVRGAEAFLCGADAIGPDTFINKVGTGALAALAALEGVPVYVLAGREKFLDADSFAQLRLAGGDAREMWRTAPAGVQLHNPYFEHVRTSVVSAFITDAGVIPPDRS